VRVVGGSLLVEALKLVVFVSYRGCRRRQVRSAVRHLERGYRNVVRHLTHRLTSVTRYWVYRRFRVLIRGPPVIGYSRFLRSEAYVGSPLLTEGVNVGLES
jgi:hypothetical protein